MQRTALPLKQDALAPPETAAPVLRDASLQGPELADSLDISVDIVSGKRFVEFSDEWRDLVARADVPNVFMNPRMLGAMAPAAGVTALLAWQRLRGKHLVGVWAFSAGPPRRSMLPLRVLRAPAIEHAYLGSPVIDRDILDATLIAMLDAVAAAPDLPKLITIDAMLAEGATFDALMRVLAQRGSGCCEFNAVQRPKLASDLDGEDYLQSALSGSSRKKLRQCRRRLGKKGKLEARVLRSAIDVKRSFEAFLALELQGWKGRRGTALASHPENADFARGMVAALAWSGEVSIHTLELDGRPVSMQVVLHAADAAYTWKTAYDETLGEFSPGMLLFEDYSKTFLADPSVAYVDSCTYDDNGYMGAWTGRQAIAGLWIDARRGVSIAFRAAVASEQGYRAVRQKAKQVYLNSPALQQLRETMASIRKFAGWRRRGAAMKMPLDAAAGAEHAAN